MPTANKDTKNTDQTYVFEPQKLVQNLVDKKIRNLEKRKTRLQELQQLAAKGQELEPEQQKAIKKLDQVVEMIDLMKDLNKSIVEVLTENTKQQKKQLKKEMLDKQIERQQQEIERLKTIIRFQDILGKFESTVRQDFTNGTNGAIKLSEDQLSNLDQLFVLITEVSDDKIETTTEKLIALADGKSRDAWTGVTFHQLKELMNSLVETKYFSTVATTTPVTDISSTTANNTNKSPVVPTTKSDESTKKFTKDNNSSNNTTKPNSGTTQFHPTIPNEFTPNLSQLQSQYNTQGISFMNPLDKDPAVVAVASVPAVPNSYPYQTPNVVSYGLQTADTFINNSIPDSNNTSINPQKTVSYDNTSTISTIPTQTFTNQQFAALIPSSAGYSAVPVTLATVPITGLVAQDISGQITADMISTQNYGNHPNFMNSSGTDKQTNVNTSHERANTFIDDHRNNRNRNNRSDPKKNLNGSGGRPRNPNNKGQTYGQNQVFGNYNPKYDNQMNGSSFGGNNSFGEKTSNNYRGNQGPRPQNQRPRQENRPRNANFNPNLAATAAK